ncbi:hypothetical protein CI238_11349 [Colletotrichum incanum]|uniref:Uncharacterized protein n=1 Tax=Colletotrichum incanum TaxID=1573173 RepID=A0A167B048_COLIC|nr:hypothetical protein CI238_11349 [Colletotrichum incanum]
MKKSVASILLFVVAAITADPQEATKVVRDSPNPVLAARAVCCSESFPDKKCVCSANSREDCAKGICN